MFQRQIIKKGPEFINGEISELVSLSFLSCAINQYVDKIEVWLCTLVSTMLTGVLANLRLRFGVLLN